MGCIRNYELLSQSHWCFRWNPHKYSSTKKQSRIVRQSERSPFDSTSGIFAVLLQIFPILFHATYLHFLFMSLSLFVQAICNHKCRFINCYAGHVGSVHDQRVFRQSDVQNYLGDATKFPQDSHLVADLAYKLHDNLMIPYRDNGHLTRRQQNHNFCHASARIVIERAFALLKGRFQSLLTTFAMHRVDLIPIHILACCVLHNICLMRGDELDFDK